MQGYQGHTDFTPKITLNHTKYRRLKLFVLISCQKWGY